VAWSPNFLQTNFGDDHARWTFCHLRLRLLTRRTGSISSDFGRLTRFDSLHVQ
jgi:hypothetical protein